MRSHMVARRLTLKPSKNPKGINKNSHTVHAQTPSGDYVGFAIPAKMGRIRDSYVSGSTQKNQNFGSPPRSLA